MTIVASPRFYAYRSTFDKLNDAFSRIHDEDGRVTQTIFLGGRDFAVIYYIYPEAPALTPTGEGAFSNGVAV